jgi:hypothetical protein
MKGKLLKEGIEEMLGNTPAAAGSFPHVSEQVEILYDPSKEKFSKIQSFKIKGKDLVDSHDYNVVISQHYVERMTDHVTSFHHTKAYAVSKLDIFTTEIVVEYLKSRTSTPIDPSLPRRLIEVSSSS